MKNISNKQCFVLKLHNKITLLFTDDRVIDFFNIKKHVFYVYFKYDSYNKRLVFYCSEKKEFNNYCLLQKEFKKFIKLRKDFSKLYSKLRDKHLILELIMDDSKKIMNNKVIIINHLVELNRCSKKAKKERTIALFNILTNNYEQQ